MAIATPPGRGGIGVVRLSGLTRTDRAPDAASAQLEPRSRDTCVDPFRPRVDTSRVLAGGESSVSAVAHGRHRSGCRDLFSRVRDRTPATTWSSSARMAARSSCARSWRRPCRSGARLAEPGEFTLRAFLNGRIDLMQAEAVADLIDAVTPLQARAAFDQLQGTLTRDDRRDRCRAVRADRAARSVDRFSGRGLPLRRSGALAQRDRRADRTHGCVAGRRRSRAAGSRRAAGGDRRQAERREVEPVQRAGGDVARDRHRRAGHDARSA